MSATTRNPNAGLKRAIRRIGCAQESGLLLVILMLMGGLALFGGSKQKQSAITLGPQATHRVLERPTGTYTLQVTTDGRVSEYDSIREPRMRDNEDGRTFFVTQRVNKFLDPANLVLVAKDASFIAIMAVGMTAVIILAGIDLSVGSIYGLSAMVGAMALTQLERDAPMLMAVPLGLVVCCAVGAICGLANGAMIVGLRVHPFVITLGMMAALRGLTVILPKRLFNTQSLGQFPESFTSGFFKAEIAGVYPVPILVMLLVAVVGIFVLSQTVFGRRVYAIGGNEIAARYAGIPVARVKIIVYGLTGMLAGLSACVYLGYLGGAESNAGNAYELRVIAATVIGGASLMGGRGSALGAVLGAIVVELINNGMIVLEIDQDFNLVVMGAAIIIAVVIDQAKGHLTGK